MTTPETQRIRAIVFDLDGVLADSAPCHRAAFEEVFAPFGVRDFDYASYAGWRTDRVVATVLGSLPNAPTPAAIAEVAAAKSKLAREKLAATNPIDPDCLAVLTKLSGSYTLALASSGSRASVEMFLEHNQCRQYFKSVLCGGDVSHAKPDPEIYLRAFAELNVRPSQGVVVEDAIAGISAALAAGAGAVVGITGTCPAAQLSSAGATRVIGALGELPDLLCSLHEHAPAH